MPRVKLCKNCLEVEVEKGLNPYCCFQCEREYKQARKVQKPKRVKRSYYVMISPITKKPYPKRSTMIKALVDDAKKEIKHRDHYRCQRCSKKVSGFDCQGSHVVPMSTCRNNALAWDRNNIKVLCHECHRWWEEHKTEGREWFARRFPERDKYLNEYKQVKISTGAICTLFDEIRPSIRSKY